MLQACAFVAGAWWLQQQAALPPLSAACLILVPVLAAVHWRSARMAPLRVTAAGAGLAACGLAGFFIAAAVATVKLSDGLPAADEGRDLRVAGVVEGLPVPGEHGWRFVFRVDRLLTPGAHVPGRVLLGWYRPRGAPEAASAPVAPGERIVFTIRLKRPHGTRNPYGFDREGWLFEQGIRATGYVNDRAPVVREGTAAGSPGAWIDRVRGALRARIFSALGDAPYAGVIVALAVGEQRAIPAGQWELFTKTGVNHLMSISGLHITMLAALVHGMVLRLWRRLPALTVRYPADDVARLAGLVTALLYVLLAGFAVPAQRTLWMLAVVTVAAWLRVFTDGAQALALALVLVVVLDPMAVISPGFWLSFGAVALLMAFTGRTVGRWAWLTAWTRTQWILFAGLAPAMLALFQQVSLVAPVANAFAIPLVGLVVVPLSLAGMLLPVDWPLHLAHTVMAWTVDGLALVGQIPGARWTQAAPPPWSVVLALAGAAWMLLPRGLPSRWLGLLAFLPLLLPPSGMPAPGTARVTIPDVGQGLAVVVRTAGGTLLFDTGPAWSADADSGSRTIVPFLRGSGIRSVDIMVVSHDDRDHTGGAASVLAQVPVDAVLTSLVLPHAALSEARRIGPCAAGQRWVWSGVTFEMLHPARRQSAQPVRDNARSCVLRVSVGGRAVLIPADVEADSERALLAGGADLSADVLVAPHHGSRTSSTPGFVAAVHPAHVVVTAGYRNRFGHPHPDIAARYAAAGATLLRSDRHGAVSFTLDGGPVRVDAWYPRHARYWHRR
jgi:competence protein ComEC